MIRDAKAGRFDFIITKEISRFSRSTLDSIQYTQELLEHDVGVLFQNDNINTMDPDSEFRLTIMAGVAQDEVRKLSERLKFGFNQAIKNGHVLGNDKLWGLRQKGLRTHHQPAGKPLSSGKSSTCTPTSGWASGRSPKSFMRKDTPAAVETPLTS